MGIDTSGSGALATWLIDREIGAGTSADKGRDGNGTLLEGETFAGFVFCGFVLIFLYFKGMRSARKAKGRKGAESSDKVGMKLLRLERN